MTTTIEVPIYDIDVIVIIDSDWTGVSKEYDLGLEGADFQVEAWTIYDQEDEDKIYVLFKNSTLDYSTICHELHHVIARICEARDIVMDHKNDEPLAYLQAYIGQRIFEIRDQFLKF